MTRLVEMLPCRVTAVAVNELGPATAAAAQVSLKLLVRATDTDGVELHSDGFDPLHLPVAPAADWTRHYSFLLVRPRT
jgi:hypothetical protein